MSDVAVALEMYAAGKVNQAGRVLAPVISRLSNVAAWEVHRKDLADDIAQDLWLHMDKVASKYNPALSPAEAYILGWLRKLARSAYRRSPFPLENLECDEDIHESLAALACAEDRIDRKLAIDAIQKRTIQMQLSPLPFVQVAPAQAKDEQGSDVLFDATSKEKQAPKKKRQKNADHLRIREIRKLLDMTQAEYAAALGLLTPTLVSYEQGQTLKVPAEIMERAESLMSSDGKEVQEWREKFENRTMKEILTEWANELNADPSDLPTMAALTGTVTSTVSRWHSGGCRPSLREIVAYDHNVKLNARRLKKSGLLIEDNRLVREPKHVSSDA